MICLTAGLIVWRLSAVWLARRRLDIEANRQLRELGIMPVNKRVSIMGMTVYERTVEPARIMADPPVNGAIEPVGQRDQTGGGQSR